MTNLKGLNIIPSQKKMLVTKIFFPPQFLFFENRRILLVFQRNFFSTLNFEKTTNFENTKNVV